MLKFHSLTETCLLCSWGGDTPLLCLPGQDYLYSAAMHLLMLQENFKLLLGCTKQSLIFIICLFILVEKDTANSNPRHLQNACYILYFAPFSHQTVQSFLAISMHTFAPRQTFSCSSRGTMWNHERRFKVHITNKFSVIPNKFKVILKRILIIISKLFPNGLIEMRSWYVTASRLNHSHFIRKHFPAT